MLKEFRDFIMRGNVLELAVAFIIGAAFNDIVTSLVNDVIMPPIGLIVGGVDFSNIVITLQQAQGEDPAVTMNIGLFINTVIEFLIVAFVVFMIVRTANRLSRIRRAEEAVEESAPAEPTPEEKLTTAIERLTEVIESRGM